MTIIPKGGLHTILSETTVRLPVWQLTQRTVAKEGTCEVQVEEGLRPDGGRWGG